MEYLRELLSELESQLLVATTMEQSLMLADISKAINILIDLHRSVTSMVQEGTR